MADSDWGDDKVNLMPIHAMRWPLSPFPSDTKTEQRSEEKENATVLVPVRLVLLTAMTGVDETLWSDEGVVKATAGCRATQPFDTSPASRRLDHNRASVCLFCVFERM